MTALLAVKNTAAIAFVCAALIFSGCGAQDASRNPQRNDVAGKICGENEFACQNGKCIKSELLCDGRADCSDQSDETQEACSKPELTCPDYAFRCSYGACVNGDATCNGIRDCLDNSDELLPRCPGVSAAAVGSEGSCASGDHTCNDGSCIDSTSLCDGKVDCADGSDETFDACGSFPCSQVVFRCNYGACIDGDLSCNGVINCADGSDEDPLLCNKPPPILPTPKPTPTPTPGPIPGQGVGTVTQPSESKRFCVVPAQPDNGQRKLHRAQCQTGIDCEISQGVSLDPGSQLVYSCNPGFKTIGNSEVSCSYGGMWTRIPICSQIRCPSPNSVSTSAECVHANGSYASCDPAALPGTRAKVVCRNGYRQDPNSVILGRPNVECDAAGRWQPNYIKCIPVCGRATPGTTPFIFNGQKANLTDFPWHATLYIVRDGKKKDLACGGTIIQTNLILTAAHCIYDDTTADNVDPKSLFIATGNLLQDYDSLLHNPRIVKKARVKNIYRHCQFYGFSGHYSSDIALLELEKPFEFSAILLPACLDLFNYADTTLTAGAEGKVAGFGRNEKGVTSGILQTLTVPFVPSDECTRSVVAAKNRFYVTAEKFCAGFTNGTSVCDGDSGGGLVFQRNELWYVMGIVSVGLGVINSDGEKRCNNFQYSLYTRVDKYMGWIQDVILDLENHGRVRPCPSS